MNPDPWTDLKYYCVSLDPYRGPLSLDEFVLLSRIILCFLFTQATGKL